ncbi:MAG: hypothetical protein OXT01_13170 [Rhodospirillaceae bacterium]|nr:hypothetical protein [Rhodospirillaceae bacterium]
MLQALSKLIGGNASDGDVPDRVRLAIAEQQDAAERLIAWIQFGIIETFGSLYPISPKTSDIDPWMTPVGMSLAAYFAFSILRVWLAYRIRLPAWFLTLSVAADLTLLMMLIWSFHIQYDQPASFYLKAPTLLYVFIFIALRALRFEARFVLLAGLFSALGWLALVFYVVSIDPQDNMITRDYVAYMTSNTILLGAEFDKVISILMVTGILCVALVKARKLLERSVIEATAAADLARNRIENHPFRSTDPPGAGRGARSGDPECRYPRLHRHGQRHGSLGPDPAVARVRIAHGADHPGPWRQYR